MTAIKTSETGSSEKVRSNQFAKFSSIIQRTRGRIENWIFLTLSVSQVKWGEWVVSRPVALNFFSNQGIPALVCGDPDRTRLAMLDPRRPLFLYYSCFKQLHVNYREHNMIWIDDRLCLLSVAVKKSLSPLFAAVC